MKYRVILTIRARNNFDAAYLWYRKQYSEVADRWYRGLRDAMRRLNQNPERFPIADEDNTFPYPLREMLYGLGRKKTHRFEDDINAFRDLRAVHHTASQVAEVIEAILLGRPVWST